MEREWKLGSDLSSYDNLLDGVTFDELILAVHCNCRKITPEAVRKTLDEILECNMQDMKFLLEKNMDSIIEAALGGRQNEICG